MRVFVYMGAFVLSCCVHMCLSESEYLPVSRVLQHTKYHSCRRVAITSSFAEFRCIVPSGTTELIPRLFCDNLITLG